MDKWIKLSLSRHNEFQKFVEYVLGPSQPCQFNFNASFLWQSLRSSTLRALNIFVEMPDGAELISSRSKTLNNLLLLLSHPRAQCAKISEQTEGLPLMERQAKMLKELPIVPSFGSHFFQNLTSLHLAYFTLNKKETKTKLNWTLLNGFKVQESTDYVKLIKLNQTLDCMIDGTSGKGIIICNQD